MKRICIHSLLFLAGALGCAAFADETTDSPSRELLDSYPYQPALLALPSTVIATDANPAVFEPTVAPNFAATKPPRYDWRDLDEAFAREKDLPATHALYVWDWRQDSQWQILSRPDVQQLNIPWSPMTTPTDATLSPASMTGATAKLQVRVPLVTLVW
jgi:hypothetical protein